jgi:hypothetical protein
MLAVSMNEDGFGEVLQTLDMNCPLRKTNTFLLPR